MVHVLYFQHTITVVPPSQQPRPARRPRADQQRNRQALLDAARELFAERGLDVPLDDIAKRSGLSNPTLYRHFPDRRSLLTEVVLGNLERHEQALADALSRDRGWDGLTQFLGWLFAQQVSEVDHLAALRAIPAGSNAEVDRLRQRTLSGFEELIRRAKSEGDMRADRWAEDIYLLLFVNEQLTRLADTPAPEASRRLLRLTLDTLAADGTRSAADHSPGALEEVRVLRRTLGHDLAGLPRAD
jgi:AcrR family transcriptional regulator